MSEFSFPDGQDAACIHRNKVFLLERQKESGKACVKKYETGHYDSTYRQLASVEGGPWQLYAHCSTEHGEKLLLAGNQGLCYLDTASGEIIQRCPAVDYNFNYLNILGVSDDCSRVYWSVYSDSEAAWDDGRAYFSLDMLSGKTLALQKPNKTPDAVITETLYVNEGIWFCAEQYEAEHYNISLNYWAFTDGSVNQLYCRHYSYTEDYRGFVDGGIAADAYGKTLYAAIADSSGNLETVLKLESETKTVTELSPNIKLAYDEYGLTDWRRDCFAWDAENEKLIFANGSTLNMLHEDKRLLFTVKTEGVASSASFSPDKESVLVLTENRQLIRYAADDSTMLDNIMLTEYTPESPMGINDSCKWIFTDENELLLCADNIGYLIDIADSRLKIRAVIDNCIGCSYYRDSIIIVESNSDACSIGSFRRQ